MLSLRSKHAESTTLPYHYHQKKSPIRRRHPRSSSKSTSNNGSLQSTRDAALFQIQLSNRIQIQTERGRSIISILYMMTSLIICAMETFQYSEEQFLIIHRIKISATPRTSLKKLLTQVFQAIPEFGEFDIDIIQPEYSNLEYTYCFQPNNLYQHFVSVKDSLLEMSIDLI